MAKARFQIDTFAVGMAPDPVPGPDQADLLGDLPLDGQWFTREISRARAELPFVPLMPFPAWGRTVLLAVDVPQEIVLPDDCAFIEFRSANLVPGAGADFYASIQGNAEIPAAATVDPSQTGERITSILNPVGRIWYVRNQKTLSVVAHIVNTVVHVSCWPEL